MTAQKKTALLLLFPFLVLFLTLLSPEACKEGVRTGVGIGTNSLFPALFPSLVLSRLIAAFSHKIKGRRALFFPLLLGLFCGFPVGAMTLSSLLAEGRIEKERAEKMLFFIGTASPSFLISYVGAELFDSIKIGWYFFLLGAAASSICAVFFFRQNKESAVVSDGRLSTHESKSTILVTALREAMHSFLFLFSCVVFFSFLSSLVLHFLPENACLAALFSAFFELSGGVRLLALLPKPLALPLTALALGWNGLAVHLQVMGLLGEGGFSFRHYYFGRLFFGGIFFFVTTFLQKLL